MDLLCFVKQWANGQNGFEAQRNTKRSEKKKDKKRKKEQTKYTNERKKSVKKCNEQNGSDTDTDTSARVEKLKLGLETASSWTNSTKMKAAFSDAMM